MMADYENTIDLTEYTEPSIRETDRPYSDSELARLQSLEDSWNPADDGFVSYPTPIDDWPDS